MKKAIATCLTLFVLMLNLSSNVIANELPCNYWQPYGDLKDIPFYNNCEVTNGDVAVAKTDGIYWCPEIAAKLEKDTPGVSHFAYVHEYGHYIHGSDERAVDCWAAKELAGTCFIPIAIGYFLKYGDNYSPNYGYMKDRAETIRICSSNR